MPLAADQTKTSFFYYQCFAVMSVYNDLISVMVSRHRVDRGVPTVFISVSKKQDCSIP